MARYTSTLSAQNTSVLLCSVERRHDAGEFFATISASGTFGGGTVVLGLSFDDGVTIIPLNQDGTATAASLTALSAVNIRLGNSKTNTPPKLYASIATATTPSIAINVIDNR